MNEAVSIASDEEESVHAVFVSYATADRKKALAVCQALEKRGTPCWISCRDVEPGENYQEAIVRHVRHARAMVLVFSEAANNSDEIKKELSLASRYRVPVLAFRIEDVEPSDAFAYELSTRQWIDAFTGWDRSIDALVRKIGQISSDEQGQTASAQETAGQFLPGTHSPKSIITGLAVAALLVIAALAWMLLRPNPKAGQSMVVRLVGFEALSRAVPEGLPSALGEEIIAAFAEDGAVSVSTTAARPTGEGQAFALSGTVRHDRDRIRVIAKLVDERSGTTLWSNGFDYASNETARIPLWVAVDVGNVLRCGLFGASTYPKRLPDRTLSDYLQVCQSISGTEFQPSRALDFARKVVAAAPDFSWGWSAVAGSAVASIGGSPTNTRMTAERIAALRKEALAAVDKAIALDPSNGEALEARSYLVDDNDLVGREAFLKQALAARSLACGCEHFSYGFFLQQVGRNRDAIEQYRRSIDVLALSVTAYDWLSVALLIQGEVNEAEATLEAAADLVSAPGDRNGMLRIFSTAAQDYDAALQTLEDPDVALPAPTIAAYRLALRALITREPKARADAVKGIEPSS